MARGAIINLSMIIDIIYNIKIPSLSDLFIGLVIIMYSYPQIKNSFILELFKKKLVTL